MRTLILLLAFVTQVSTKAQTEYGRVITPDTTIPDYVWKRCAETVDNMKPYMTMETVSQYGGNIIRAFSSDLDSAVMACLSFGGSEDNGSVDDTSDEGHGFFNVHKVFMYDEYREIMSGKKEFVDFPFEALDDPNNIHYSIIILDFHFGPNARYQYKNRDETIVTWNIGNGGLTDTDPEIVKRRENYPKKFWNNMRCFADLVRLGYMHVM